MRYAAAYLAAGLALSAAIDRGPDVLIEDRIATVVLGPLVAPVCAAYWAALCIFER